jgi:hypothetical protein
LESVVAIIRNVWFPVNGPGTVMLLGLVVDPAWNVVQLPLSTWYFHPLQASLAVALRVTLPLAFSVAVMVIVAGVRAICGSVMTSCLPVG